MADIQCRREEMEARERGEARTATEGGGIALRRGGTSRKKRPRREQSDTETEAAGGQAGTSQGFS